MNLDEFVYDMSIDVYNELYQRIKNIIYYPQKSSL